MVRVRVGCLVLNYQNNAIPSIGNLRGLPNLIFLDLYNNAIERISGLSPVPTPRVRLRLRVGVS